MDDILLQQKFLNPENRVEALLSPRRAQGDQGERNGNYSYRDGDYAQYIHKVQSIIRF